MRSCLVPLIYEKTLSIKMEAAEESGPLTLMSADIEKIAFGMRYMHEAWGNIIEIALALWLLYRQLNYGGLSPIVIATRKATFYHVTKFANVDMLSLWSCSSSNGTCDRSSSSEVGQFHSGQT